MRDPDEVRLVIEGQELTGFDAVTIEMAADQIADGFSLTAPFDPNDIARRRLFRPFGYQPVQVYLGEDLVLSGRVDKVSPGLSGGDRVVTIEGRSKPGALCDCSLDEDLEFSGLTLAAIAQKAASSRGVQVRVDADSEAIPETRAEYGQEVGSFLNSLAAPRNLLLNSSYDGKLVISSGAALASRSPVADLVEGQWPLRSVSASYDSTGRFSLYRIATQFAGMEDITGEARDAGVSIVRPKLSAAGETPSDPNTTAARLRSEAIASAISLTASCTGWRRPDGARWSERQVVNLLAPSAMVYYKTAWLVAGCTFRLDGSGRTTDLRLVPRELYAGLPVKEPIWV